MNPYRNMMNAQARKALMKVPQMPDDRLAVGEDEPHNSIAVTIQNNRHQPASRPVVVNYNTLPYEKTVAKGSGDTLSIDDFVTDDFGIGQAFG